MNAYFDLIPEPLLAEPELDKADHILAEPWRSFVRKWFRIFHFD